MGQSADHQQDLSLRMIRAGKASEAIRNSGEWVFIDLGFAEKAMTCGWLFGDGQPEEVLFAGLTSKLLDVVASGEGPLNLLIEAPLSVAFNEHGNPTGRSIEKRNGQTRYWYVGLGCAVLVAATYLLRSVSDAGTTREVRLFEGFVSFKPKGQSSSHSNDVLALRSIVWNEVSPPAGIVVPAERLAVSASHELQSAFRVSGMDFGVPAVVVIGG